MDAPKLLLPILRKTSKIARSMLKNEKITSNIFFFGLEILTNAVIGIEMIEAPVISHPITRDQ
jgi:hypothetical protein